MVASAQQHDQLAQIKFVIDRLKKSKKSTKGITELEAALKQAAADGKDLQAFAPHLIELYQKNWAP
jgi:hypothetical protein